MKWIRLFVFIILMSIFIPSGIVLAASPSVDDVKVFTDYEHTGDWLIVATYNISGGNFSDCTNTSCFRSPAYQWYIEFIDNTDPTDPITKHRIEQGGMKPFGISINASIVTSLSWSGNYSVKIYGDFNVIHPNASRTLVATDWRGAVADGELKEWVRQQAQIMEDYTGVDYITVVDEYDEVLTVDGGSIFNSGIPYLKAYLPSVFQVTTYTYPIGYVPSNGSTSYATNLYTDWATALGPDVSGSLTTVAPYFGFTGANGGRMVGALLTLIGFLSLALVSQSVAFMVILGGVMIGVFPMATVVMLVFILAVVLIRSLFWSST